MGLISLHLYWMALLNPGKETEIHGNKSLVSDGVSDKATFTMKETPQFLRKYTLEFWLEGRNFFEIC